MKILPDQNLLRRLAAHLIGHQCRTVVECRWSGKKNGELLAERAKNFLPRLAPHEKRRGAYGQSCAP